MGIEDRICMADIGDAQISTVPGEKVTASIEFSCARCPWINTVITADGNTNPEALRKVKAHASNWRSFMCRSRRPESKP